MFKIAFASGKGGTGKTTLAVSCAFAARESINVMIADFDVEEPNAGIFIKPENIATKPVRMRHPEIDEEVCSRCRRCVEVCAFNAIKFLGDHPLVFPELCHDCRACEGLCPAGAIRMVPRKIGTISYSDSPLPFVEGRLDIGQEQAVPVIRKLFQKIGLMPEHDLLILDSPPGTSCPVVQVFRNSDFAILVTEPTPFGLHDLKLAVEAARMTGIPFAVVINKLRGEDSWVTPWLEEQSIPVWARFPDSTVHARRYATGGVLYGSDPEFDGEMQGLLQKIRQRMEAGS